MEEMLKLVCMLNKARMEYRIDALTEGYQLFLLSEDRKVILDDAIWKPGSIGYYQGLLESYKANDCRGYETAEDIIGIWKQYYNI